MINVARGLLVSGILVFTLPAFAGPTLKCVLAERHFEVAQVFLTEFDSQGTVLYTAANDADGAGRLGGSVQGDIEVIEYSNECDNLFHFEFEAAALNTVRGQIARGEYAKLALNGTLNFWMLAEESEAVTTSISCTFDPDFKRVFPLDTSRN